MIFKMRGPEFDTTFNSKVASFAKAEFDAVVARLGAVKSVRFRNRKVTKEAVLSALWMWMGEMDLKEVQEAMARYIPELESKLTEMSEKEDKEKVSPNTSPELHVGTRKPTAKAKKRRSG